MAFSVEIGTRECDKCRKVLRLVEMYERHRGEQANILRLCLPCIENIAAKLKAYV